MRNADFDAFECRGHEAPVITTNAPPYAVVNTPL